MKELNTFKKYLKEGKINEETFPQVYIVIPFYSGGVDINENDIVVFHDFDTAQEYRYGLEGSPMIVKTDLK